MRGWLSIAVVLLGARTARADGVLEELAAGSVPATPSAPGSHWLSDKVAGMWDATSAFQLRLDVSTTRLYAGSTDSHGDVVLGSLSAVYTIDDHWTVRGSASWSPQSTTLASVPVDMFVDAAASAQLRASASSLAASGAIDFDSAGTGDEELTASLSVTATYFSSEQAVTGVVDASGRMLGPQAARMSCETEMCSSDLTGALTPQWVQLGQYAVGASVTDTVQQATDISLDASYFLYDSDPMQFGYYALATVGRGALGSAAGVAPLRDAITPSVTHRWGNLGINASLSYADYVAAQGSDISASVRVQYKIALAGERRLKLYAKLGGAGHFDATGALASSGSTAIGAQFSW